MISLYEMGLAIMSVLTIGGEMCAEMYDAEVCGGLDPGLNTLLEECDHYYLSNGRRFGRDVMTSGLWRTYVCYVMGI